MDANRIATELKKGLEGYGFRQKENSPFFFYDCNWYFIFTEIIEAEDDVFVINGIQFLWSIENFAVIREETNGDLNYHIKTFSPDVVENLCKWINTKKEYFLNLYKNPEEMLVYLKKYNDMSHQSNGYIIARLLKKKDGVDFFKNTTRERLKEINANPNNYFPYVNEKTFRQIEYGLTELMGMDDKKFVEEITNIINRTRTGLNLKTLDGYFS